MVRLLAVTILVSSIVGCSALSGGGGGRDDGSRSSRSASPSRPSRWEAAKVSYFSTQVGGMVKQQRIRLASDTPFGSVSGPCYMALVTKGWVDRDRRREFEEARASLTPEQLRAVESGRLVMKWVGRDDVHLDEPFELVRQPNVKVIDDVLLGKLLDQLEEEGFFDMPSASELAIREDGKGGYTLPPGRAWLMVQLDDWRRTIALDDLRSELVPRYTTMTNAFAGTFTAVVAPQASVVLEPIDFSRMRPGRPVTEPRADAELLDDGRARYRSAPKSDARWWEKEPEKPQDSLWGPPK